MVKAKTFVIKVAKFELVPHPKSLEARRNQYNFHARENKVKSGLNNHLTLNNTFIVPFLLYHGFYLFFAKV